MPAIPPSRAARFFQPVYGSGLRLMECAELRVKDVHLDRGELTEQGGKGARIV